MRSPTLSELPIPENRKTGWPWTEENQQLSDRMPGGASWPLVSIVTPSYNQGSFLEETIRSVLLQGYPNLEYIIIDGGSTDNSVAIIRKYAPWLSYWVSEPDRGQAHAINKGFRAANGELLAWLNSDDIYVGRSVIEHIALRSRAYPGADVITGSGILLDEKGHWIHSIDVQGKYAYYRHLRYRDTIFQPATFFKKYVVEAIPLDESLMYTFDWDFFVRMSKAYNILPVPDAVAGYRMYGRNKTAAGGEVRIRELAEVTGRYLGRTSWQYGVLKSFLAFYRAGEKLPGPARLWLLSGIKKMSSLVTVMSFKRITGIDI